MHCSNISNRALIHIQLQLQLRSLVVVVCLLFVNLFFIILFTPIANAKEAEIVLVNRPPSDTDKRYEYPTKLLTIILKKTEKEYGPAVIVQSESSMARNRILIELEKGLIINVIAVPPKPGWEERLIPIRIPIRKGIQGFRTFLILKKNQAMLSSITSLEALKKIPTGSGQQWSTTRILNENGFDVRPGNSYEGLFNMLVYGRFITFGRGINEAAIEYETHKIQFPELAIEKDLLLFIPLPTYFFVSPKKPKLAERIEVGLSAMLEDGSFDDLFNQEFGELIKKSNLKNRRIFKINNPNLSPETPLNVENYWYNP